MPVVRILRKQTNLQMCPAQAILLRKFYLSSFGNSLSTSLRALQAPLSPTPGWGILRHLSVSPNLLIFAKLTSFISKLAIEPDSPQRPLESKLANKADAELDTMHKEIVDKNINFLEEYDKNLDMLVKQVKPLPKEISQNKVTKRTYKKKERAQKTKEKLRFFQSDKLSRPTVTAQFKGTFAFLQTIGIPCDELRYFPDIQRMTKDEILMCIDRLKSYGIHKVFSLFLIHRTLADMKIAAVTASPRKIRDRRTPVPQLRQVRLYLSLCQMLEKPDLDIIPLLDMLTTENGFESMATLHTKVKKLLSMGATAEIIWANLELLTMSKDIFDKKIKLYKHSRPSVNTPFPVALFLSKSFVAFQERLNVGQDILEIAEMLDISPADFQACWGFRKLNTAELVQKVRMCIKVGINKKDIFNNLSMLNSIPTEKCYEVTTGFQETGLPASIFILKEMDQANGINGGHFSHNGSRSLNKQTQNEEAIKQNGSEEGSWESAVLMQDEFTQGWASDSEETEQMPSSAQQRPAPIKKNRQRKPAGLSVQSDNKNFTPVIRGLTIENKSSSKKQTSSWKKSASNNTVESSKRSRRVLFNLVAHLLSLEPQALSNMFRCCLSITSVHRVDITRNLDFLLTSSASGGGGFTLEQLAQCPLILVHPHGRVKAVTRSVAEMVDSYLVSSSCLLTESSSTSTISPAPSLWDDLHDDDKDEEEGEQSRNFVQNQGHDTIQNSGPNSRPSLSAPDSPRGENFLQCQSRNNAGNKHTPFQPAADTTDPVSLKKLLFSNPQRHLNLLQYLLEKDSSFSLGASGAHVDSGFLNRPF
ncbi:hypothetical protein PoB_007201600 [Plakobranchus ocellatus]|uniref:Uncharacterized protein n=1 Tax=Plakobranchus ocellatus TaxID=259542 RepID=A0AAV4DNS3_9GAST|nr:hypothetical protein PoB_007201600 [Plakobranchus ocellatus]